MSPIWSELVIEELHVAGIVVYVYPNQVDTVALALRQFTGAQLHASAPDGRLVVTLEAPSAAAIADRMGAIQQLEGVLSCALVYQHNESVEAMMQELADADHAPRFH